MGSFESPSNTILETVCSFGANNTRNTHQLCFMWSGAPFVHTKRQSYREQERNRHKEKKIFSTVDMDLHALSTLVNVDIDLIS